MLPLHAVTSRSAGLSTRRQLAQHMLALPMSIGSPSPIVPLPSEKVRDADAATAGGQR